MKDTRTKPRELVEHGALGVRPATAVEFWYQSIRDDAAAALSACFVRLRAKGKKKNSSKTAE